MSQKLRTNIILIFKRKKAEYRNRGKSENTIFIIGRVLNISGVWDVLSPNSVYRDL
jgi:hypothetical protein